MEVPIYLDEILHPHETLLWKDYFKTNEPLHNMNISIGLIL